MSGFFKQTKNSHIYEEPEDPCKPYGCELQSCYVHMMKYGGIKNDKNVCKEERIALEVCREKHNLLTNMKITDEDRKIADKVTPQCQQK